MVQFRYERLYADSTPLEQFCDENEEIELKTELNVEDKDDHKNTRKLSESLDNVYVGANNEENSRLKTVSPQNLHRTFGTVATILVYLVLSICLTFYQRNMIKKYKFPFCIVCYHLIIKLALATTVRSLLQLSSGKARVLLDFPTSLKKMAPTGFASGIDIGFSNWGLELVRISLYTMTKSSTIIFILFFAILLGLEKKNALLFFTVSLIASGLLMFTYKSTQFDPLGFIFLLVASLSSGIRWSFAQLLMQKTKLGLQHPIDMIYHMQPWMIASLLPFFIAIEAKDLFNLLSVIVPNASASAIFFLLIKITFGAFLAFLMEVTEFMVLSKTSGLSLSIAGIFKDVCQVVLAVEINGDKLSFINVVGLIVCLAGISSHLVQKYKMLTNPEHILSSENDSSYHKDINGSLLNSGLSLHSHNGTPVRIKQKHSALTLPLLDQFHSIESNDDSDGPNASDVIFDVLKRRDMSV